MRKDKVSPARLVLAAFLVASCRKGSTPAPPAPSASASASPSAGTLPSAALPGRPLHPAPVHEGSAIARSVEGDALFVADEDHARLHRVALPLATEIEK